MESALRTVAVSQRSLVLRMDGEQALEIAKLGVAAATGSGGLALFRWWAERRRKRSQEPVEITAKLIDDGDELRRLLLERVTKLEADHSAAIERAHRAELELAALRPDVERLRSRLERKDEQAKALCAQIVGLGAVPVSFVAPSGRRDGERDTS